MTRQIHNYPVYALWSLAIALMLVTDGPAYAAEPEMIDQAISDEIEDELLFDEGVTLHKIDVNTSDGIVTLTGTVNNILSKERAAKIAELVKGVRSVVNRIQVKPSQSITDQRVKTEVDAALARDPATDSYEITVDVNDGAVTLEGSVDSYKEKQLCARVAKGVKGVTELENDITVDYKYDRSDLEIRKEIEQALRWNVLVDHALINVEVNDGNVTLSGSVGSAAEKSEARWNCWVAGVESVDNSDLEVVGWMRDEKMRVNKYAIKSHEEIRDAINDALLRDPRTWAFKVDVDVAGSAVTLRGTVDNLKSKRAAEQIARNTVGVNHVSNRLKVRTEELADDGKIETSIRRAMENDPWLNRYDITVTVYDGEVYLYGTVDNYFEKSQAEDLASRVYGVVNVHNNLIAADGNAFTYDPFLDDTYVDSEWYDYEPDYNLTLDSELQEEVESELYWSPFVNEESVNVEVDDRRVMLSGTVGSASERRQAELNAWQAGAKWVDNDLVWD